MILGMTTSAFTLVHVLISLAGIGTGFIVICGLLTGKRLDGWSAIFLNNTRTNGKVSHSCDPDLRREGRTMIRSGVEIGACTPRSRLRPAGLLRNRLRPCWAGAKWRTAPP